MSYPEVLDIVETFSIERKKTENSIEDYEKEIEKLRQELNRVYNTKSWKITRPMRKIIGIMRNLKKKRK